MKRVFILLSVFLIFSSSLFAESVLKLKNGSVIKGSVVEMIPDSVIKFKSGDGSLWVFKSSEVLSVSAEETPVAAPVLQKEEPIVPKESVSTENVIAGTDATSSQEVPSGTDLLELQDGIKSKGFRVRVEGIMEVGDFFTIGHDAVFSYQFNRNFQMGLGVGIRYQDGVIGNYSPMVPIFADLNVNFVRKKVTPFFGMKAGAACLLGDGASYYFSPSVGVRINYRDSSRSLFVSLGCSMADAGYYYYYEDIWLDYEELYPSYDYCSYYDSLLGFAFCLRVGLQF